MDKKHGLRPSEVILDHFVPHLEPEERELARQRLGRLAGLLVRIAMRQVREEMASDSRELAEQGKIRSASLPPS